MPANNEASIFRPRIGVVGSLVLFGVPALALWAATHAVVPGLVDRGWMPLAAWFVAGGALVFVPLMALAIVGASAASPGARFARLPEILGVRPMTGRDWRVAAFALLATYAVTAALQQAGAALWPGLPPHPPFMKVEPLAPGQYWILLAWLPFFFANIVGEELWWRGYIQPRQMPVFKSATWLVQGALHLAFHASFGLGVILLVWPVVFAIPWAVQRTRNTTVGIVVHGGVNGPGFLAVTLGLFPAA